MESQKDLIENLLRDDHCLIHVNTTFAGILLPGHLKSSPTVTLKISYHFAGMLSVTETEIHTELRFGGIPHSCTIPMGAVWGATSAGGFHTTWDANAPNPLLPMMLKKDQKEEKPAPMKAVSKTKSEPKQKKTEKERPSFLKRIK